MILLKEGYPRLHSFPVSDWDMWTFDRLSGEQIAYIASLPPQLQIEDAGITIIHHPPGAPYLHPAMPDYIFKNHLQAVAGDIIFTGHSHREIDSLVNEHRFLCITAAGQPRNFDPQQLRRLRNTFQVCRVQY